jgi:hypothetical protein
MTEVVNFIDLIEDYTAPTWRDWDNEKTPLPGFRILLAMSDAPMALALTTRLPEQAGFERTEQYLREAVRVSVRGWEGLTVAGLRRLMTAGNLKFEGDEAQPVPYSPELRDVLVRLSGPFFLFVLVYVNKKRLEEQADAKNSETSPAGTPIPAAAPAPAAGTSKTGGSSLSPARKGSGAKSQS